MANDRRWIAIASLGLVAVFVVGMSLFPTGLVGGVDSGAALHGRKLCGNHNDELAQFVKEVKAQKSKLLPNAAGDFTDFLGELKASLDAHQLDKRAHLWLFDDDMRRVHPACGGDWMEFGVFNGGSINISAVWRRRHCGVGCPPLFGFDTFTGLPEAWSQDGGVGVFGGGAFSLDGIFPVVEPNVQLIKGLFSDSLPPFLRMEKEMHDRQAGEIPLAYLHVDCDLYAGSKDIFTLLNHKIVPGTVIVFDELVNYKLYKEHEVKAFWEWLNATKAKVATIGMKGPIQGQAHAMDIDLAVREHPQHQQGAAFVVVEKPGATMRIGW